MNVMLKRIHASWLPPLLIGFASGALVFVTTTPL